jgi:phenylpropionate dioxygenase-like ring-hydroxylating dioxygenase large terminal subunit
VSLTRARIDEGPPSGAALPSHWYVDDGILERELELIFERSWQCVGMAHQLVRPGDFVTGQVGRIPIVVIRDERGALRGYVNVCLHRCSVIAHGSGNADRLRCPYHAWTYDLDGQLITAPRFNLQPDFDFSAFRLAEVQVDRLGPFVMVNTDPSAPSLAEQLDGLEERMERDGLRFVDMVHAGHWESEQEANWKVLVENFNECYHCPVAHPGFSRLLAVDPEHYRSETSRWTSRSVVPLRARGTAPIDGYPEGENDKGQYALLWPNFTLSQSPGPRRVVACWFEPITASRTRMVCETFVDPNVSAEDIAALDRFSTQVATEDQMLVEAVQRGMRSGRVPRGYLMAETEQLVIHFDRLVARALEGHEMMSTSDEED